MSTQAGRGKPYRSGIDLAASAAAAHIEMEMVFMRFVIVWPQRNGEQLTATAMESVEELSFRTPVFPMRFHRDLPPIFQPHPRNINGICACVF